MENAVAWPVSYASPAIVKVDGKDHVVMVTSSTNPFQRTSPDNELATSSEWTRLREKSCGNMTSGSVTSRSRAQWMPAKIKCLIVGGYELGATMIKVEKKAEGRYGTTELFTTKEFGDQTKPPVQHKGHFLCSVRNQQSARRHGVHEHGGPDPVEDQTCTEISTRAV